MQRRLDTMKAGICRGLAAVSGHAYAGVRIGRVMRLIIHLAMEPEDIPLGYYTHINFAFALIDPKTFRIALMDLSTASLYQHVTALKV